MSELNENGLATADCTVTVFNYALTGEYIGSSSVSLIKGVGIPAFSTMIAPPDAKAGANTRVFTPASSAWSYVEDHRGQVVYDTATGLPHTIAELGPIDTTKYSTSKPAAVPAPLKTQAASAQAWIQQQANLAAAMGETFTADMRAYVKAIAAIASGTDTTSTALPAQPADVMAASTASDA